MLSLLISILGILLTLFIIVGIHEFSHFITARILGIKVLRFSIGFGKVLARWHDKKGTEYALSLFPLGGYVKMLDENEGPVPPEELVYAFNRQPLYKKIAVVMAGPLSNLVLAFVLYWALFMIGFITPLPVIGEVLPHSIAANAGIKAQESIVSINQHTTSSWPSVMIRLLAHIGNKETLAVETQSLTTQKNQIHMLDLSEWQMNDLNPDPLLSLGIVPFQPKVPPVIGYLEPDSPAVKSKLQVGDTVLSIQHQAIKEWEQISNIIAKNPSQTLLFTIQRQGKTLTFPVTIGYTRSPFFAKQGHLGISPNFKWPEQLLKKNKYGPLAAFSHAKENTLQFISLNFLFFGKLITGKLSLHSLGGPITIFQGAGTALNNGFLSFMGFLAFLSIAVGVINFIPIPGLDGGHLLFYLIEFISRRPLSMRVQILFYRLGMILIFMLMMQALANDLMRLGA